MRFLADENFPASTVDRIRAAGHDVAWIRLDSPGSADEFVLARSVKEQRILLTLDKDFGELVFLRGAGGSEGVVLFRVSLPSPERTATFIEATLSSRDDWSGNFSVVEPGRVRMRRLP